MGMYTMFEGRFTMKPTTPAWVWDALEWMAQPWPRETLLPESAKGKHPLFETSRFIWMLGSCSAYLEDSYVGRRNIDRTNRIIDVGFDMKNYDDEIQHLVEMLGEHVEKAEGGRYRYEECEHCTPVHIKDGRLQIDHDAKTEKEWWDQ